MSTTHLAHYAPVTVRCVTATDPDTGEVGIALDYANGVTRRVRMSHATLLTGLIQMAERRDYGAWQKSHSATSSGIPSPDGSPNDGQKQPPVATSSAACCGEP